MRLPSEQIKEGSFKVTRMRCWRVTSSVSATCLRGPGEQGGLCGVWWDLAVLGCSGSSPQEKCWLCCLLPAQLVWGGSELCFRAEGVIGVRTFEGATAVRGPDSGGRPVGAGQGVQHRAGGCPLSAQGPGKVAAFPPEAPSLSLCPCRCR